MCFEDISDWWADRQAGSDYNCVLSDVDVGCVRLDYLELEF